MEPTSMAKVDDRGRFGRKVALLRATLGITQAELARRTGYTRQAVQMIEAGKTGTTDVGRMALAAALGVRPETLPPAPTSRRK